MVDVVDDARDLDSFFTRAKQALNDLLEVKVVTVVGDVPVTITTTGDSTATQLGEGPTKLDGKAIVTVVKLADGDVTTVIAEDLVANVELRALHDAQVAASLEVLPRNLKGLVEIAKSLRNL